ncbi:uncharacterized protein LOC116287361 [Actinia tenebrosa]|uniref:Uncharacterized protein LOC116287361 n=1 Tax=Actinia tenebrosa TaxID=6105 RepID=A0A6P8HB51_ACTTE|nr:uncharacterized protein LOC116287361 [Actinia tenebrosa]
MSNYMADSNSNSSGSSSSAEHSGSGQSTRKTSRRPKVAATDSPTLNSSSSSLTPKWLAKTKAKDGHGHGSNIYNLVDCDVDRETAARAVAMVVRAANKRGYVSLCTEFATLLRDKERLQTELKLNLLAQKSKRTATTSNQCTSCSSTDSGSGGSASSTTRGTQTKPFTLLESSASSVGSSSLPTVCADACVSTEEYINLSDNGCSHPTEKNSTVDQELRKAKEYVSKLEYQLYAVKAENQALKTQLRHSQKPASKVSHLGLNESQGHNKVVKGSKLEKDRKSPESTIAPQASPISKRTLKKETAQSFSSHLKKDQNPNHDQSCSLKSCVKHRIRNGFGQSTPTKIYPMPSNEPPPILSADSKPQSAGNQLVPLQLNKYQSSCDKKPVGHMPKVLPKIGDFVVVQGEVKGYVNYIGPLKGGTSNYVGLHLNSPVGNNNGSIDGVRYFTCPANYGAFVCVQDITQVIPKSPPKEVISVNNMPFQSKNELNRPNCFERSANNQFTQDQEERLSVEIAA